jgi:hypothetical protein
VCQKYKKDLWTKNSMACTVVTAYYEIKSKFNKERYLSWANTFLKLKSPIVLFTDESMVETFTTMREGRPLHIIVIPFEELETWKKYQTHWKEQLSMDPEAKNHSPELYAVWAEKPFFVEKAIHVNPFQTEYFFWCDIGAFRNPHVHSLVLHSFPLTKYLEKDTILFQSIGDLTDREKLRRKDGIYGEAITSKWNETRLVGGLWGGGISACLEWRKQYQFTLECYFLKNRFAGKDQQVMLSTYMNCPILGKVIECSKGCIDKWFFFQYLLSDIPTPYQLNPTYFM